MGTVIIVPRKSGLQPESRHPARGVAPFRLAPIDENSLLLPPVGVGAVSQSQCGWSVLSDQLPVIGLVSRYPTNYLMGRRPLHRRTCAFPLSCASLCGLSGRFRPATPPPQWAHSHVFLSRAPLRPRRDRVRLACIRHAASVRPEPGSNSSNVNGAMTEAIL